MPASVDKAIVTNLRVIKDKYKKDAASITAAIKTLVTADKQRGITTRLIDLDNANEMNKYGATPVTEAADPKQNKTAIDGVFTALQPDYLLILGAVDVIPHQDLTNPAYDPKNDIDENAYGDLPYACEAPYSKSIADFTGPTRVVGRLPDLTGSSDAGYLVGLLNVAANYKSLTYADYTSYFGVSAEVWEESTTLSLRTVFGSATEMAVVPPSEPPWKAALLGRRSYFINCHGAELDWRFYGQPAHQALFPVALDATQLPGKITEGTVLATECCYGAELYNPADAGGKMGVCNTCLANKAYGYFGSSTIAYGPADFNDWADLLCQYFWNHVLKGASLGRAALEARHEYAQAHTVLSAVDLKTLAQFSLMGDPSLVPVQVAAEHVISKGRTARPGAVRELRRSRLTRTGLSVGETIPTAAVRAGAPSKSLCEKLRSALPGQGYGEPTFLTFQVEAPELPSYSTKRAARPRAHGVPAAPAEPAAQVDAVYLAMASQPTSPIRTPQISLVVAIEQDGQLIVKRGFSR